MVCKHGYITELRTDDATRVFITTGGYTERVRGASSILVDLHRQIKTPRAATGKKGDAAIGHAVRGGS